MYYLRNQTAYVKWNGISSNVLQIRTGTRQGGCISPFIFKLYIDNMIREVSNADILANEPPCKLGILKFSILAYADDVVLIAPSKKMLTRLYTVFINKILDLRLKLNKKKTMCMVFSKNGRYVNNDYIMLNTDKFDVCDSYKYLGYMFQSNLDDTYDIELRMNKFYAQYYSIKRSFNHVGSNALYFLFKSYVQPDYGLALWDWSVLMRKQSFKIFESAYAKILKSIFGRNKYYSNHEIAKEKNFLLFKELCLVNQCRYFKRIMQTGKKFSVVANSFLKGGLLSNLNKILISDFDVNFFENDLDVLKARISFVQNNLYTRI